MIIKSTEEKLKARYNLIFIIVLLFTTLFIYCKSDGDEGCKDCNGETYMCGNSSCESDKGENSDNCPSDCLPYECGDSYCDSDNGENYENYIIDDLANIGKTYHHWDNSVFGLPTSEIRNAYPSKNIIWFTGDTSSSPLTQDEINEISDHLSNGGKLFLSGQDIAEYNTGQPLLNLIGIEFNSNSVVPLVLGVTGDLISSGLTLFTSGGGGAQNQLSRDVLSITDSTTTTSIFHYGTGTANPAGIRYANSLDGSVVVFLGFGFESINDASIRQTLLTRIFDYLNDPATGIDNLNSDKLIPN